MEMNRLTGSLKAAILIHSMGRPVAERILNRLTQEEKELVNQHLAQMGSISTEVVEKVAMEFTALAQRVKSDPSKLSVSGANTETAQKQADSPSLEVAGLKALLEFSAEDVYDLIKDEHPKALLEFSAEDVYDLIKDEHPQTIAIILIHLNTAVASDVISKMSDEIKADVALRITRLEKVNASMVEEINQGFTEILKNKKTVVADVGGLKKSIRVSPKY
jgi:flagellar motor switch protein FliG